MIGINRKHRNTTITGIETFKKQMDRGQAGDNLTVKMKLNYPLPILVGQRFAVREGGKTVAAGVITKLGEDSKEDI